MTDHLKTTMDEALTLEGVDADGAVREAAAGDTRAAFLARCGMLGGGLLGGGALLSLMADDAGAQSRRDVHILNFALTLEYLEAAFYTEAEKMGALDGELALFARVVGAHERAHVRALKKVLGRRAVKRPRFNFRGTTESARRFAATARALEDTASPPTRARRRGSGPMRCWRPPWRSTPSRRATRAGFATSPAARRRRGRSTSPRRSARCCGSSPGRTSSRRRGARTPSARRGSRGE